MRRGQFSALQRLSVRHRSGIQSHWTMALDRSLFAPPSVAMVAANNETHWSGAMRNMTIVELKPFVPARDFALSKRFYQDLGFELAWSSEDLAYLRHGNSSFLLQRSNKKKPADNFMMHLLVEDVEAWWSHVQDQGLVARYGARTDPPADRSWGIRDFVIIDPTGVLWRIGQNIADVHVQTS